ncbi:hypothetical protein PG989_007071 [Apiospora arundinis]
MASEQIIPVHEFDSMAVYPNIMLSLMLKYDKILDPIILRDSMIELVNREGWCKLGSRLKRNVNTTTSPSSSILSSFLLPAGVYQLVYHLPAKFDENTPAITFTHEKHDTDLENHPIGCKIPRHPDPDKPSVVANPAEFDTLARRADAPRNLDDFINRDLPQLELHVVSFRNATIVSVSCLHSLLDGMGLGSQGLFNGWMLVLQGRQDEIPPACGFDNDLLKDLGKRPTEEHKYHRFRMGGWCMIWYLLRRAFQFLWHRAEEGRIVCIPASFMQQLRQSVLEELEAGAGSADTWAGESGKDEKGKKPWVSEGDVLVAWWTRYATLHLRNKPNKTICVSNAYNLRRILSGNLLPAGHAYLSNAVLGLFMLPKARDIFERPLSWMAAQMRRSIVETGTRGQVEALIADVMPDWSRPASFRMYGDPGMHMVVFTNWTQAQFYQVDLSPAAVDRETDGEGQQRPLMPSFVSYRISSKIWPMRDSFCIIGKDSEGRYWVGGVLQKGLWAKIDKELQQGTAVGI